MIPPLVILRSPHSIEECRKRLRDNIAFWPFSSRPMRGWIIGDHAALHGFGYNSWRNHLYLRLEQGASGTDIRCRAYMSRVMIVFHALIFGSVVAQTWRDGWLIMTGMLILSAAFWSAFIVLGLYTSRREPTELREIVCNALSAKPVTPLPPPPED